MQVSHSELTLLSDSDPRLRTKTERFNPREDETLKDLVDAMFAIMRKHDGIGLAAPQVGVMKRFFIMEIGNKKYVCVNPRIEKAQKETKSDSEGCLSFPGQRVLVDRSVGITVTFQDIRGSRIKKKLIGMTARCFQHELDHLNGITFLERGTVIQE